MSPEKRIKEIPEKRIKEIIQYVLPVEVTAGSRATDIRELRQARKGAAVTVLDVCRGGAWLSLVSAILLCDRKVIVR